MGLRDFYIESGEAQHPNNNISPDQLFVLDRKVREKANKLLTNKLSSITTLVGLQTFLVEKQVARNDRIISANQSDILDKKVDEKIKILRKNPL